MIRQVFGVDQARGKGWGWRHRKLHGRGLQSRRGRNRNAHLIHLIVVVVLALLVSSGGLSGKQVLAQQVLAQQAPAQQAPAQQAPAQRALAQASITPVFPGATWSFKTPAELGMDKVKLMTFAGLLGGHGAVVRYGTMAYTWGDQAINMDLASADKPIYTTLLLKAVELGKLGSADQKIDTFEPCVDSLNASLGFKDRNITFRQMANQISGYGVQEAPGTAFDYNDYQMALFVDTLFLKVWGAGTWSNVDADVLTPYLANALHMQDSPSMNVAGLQPGRVAMSVRDFARVGLLYLNQGNWNGAQVLSPQDAIMAVTNPVSSAIPGTAAVAAQMCPNQRSIGSTAIPDNQYNHYNSYSWTWWVNGITSGNYMYYGMSADHHFWWDAPADTYVACGHMNCRRGMAVIPSMGLIASWNDTALDQSGMDMYRTMDEVLERLTSAVVADHPITDTTRQAFLPVLAHP